MIRLTQNQKNIIKFAREVKTFAPIVNHRRRLLTIADGKIISNVKWSMKKNQFKAPLKNTIKKVRESIGIKIPKLRIAQTVTFMREGEVSSISICEIRYITNKPLTGTSDSIKKQLYQLVKRKAPRKTIGLIDDFLNTFGLDITDGEYNEGNTTEDLNLSVAINYGINFQYEWER